MYRPLRSIVQQNHSGCKFLNPSARSAILKHSVSPLYAVKGGPPMTDPDRPATTTDFLLRLEKALRALADPAYQSFQSRLIPTLPTTLSVRYSSPLFLLRPF